MLTVAGVVAKNNLVVDAEQKTIVNRMMVIMNKRWCSSSYVVDESHLYMMRGLLDSENGSMEPAFTVNHTGVTFNRGIFGVGTLYWHETTSYVFFASEIKALFSLKELSPKPDIKGLIENFVYWTPLCNRTAFIGVKRLECSQSVTFDSNGVNISNHPMVFYENGTLSTPKIRRMNPAVSPAAIVGSIPCGSPEEKEAQVEEYLPLSVSFFGKGDFYALRASGSSMTGAQIDDGDLVIIRQQHTAQVGEIVVALTDEDKNTLKRLLYDDDRQSYYLHPENKDMGDIYVSGLRVQGVATHVIKAL